MKPTPNYSKRFLRAAIAKYGTTLRIYAQARDGFYKRVRRVSKSGRAEFHYLSEEPRFIESCYMGYRFHEQNAPGETKPVTLTNTLDAMFAYDTSSGIKITRLMVGARTLRTLPGEAAKRKTFKKAKPGAKKPKAKPAKRKAKAAPSRASAR